MSYDHTQKYVVVHSSISGIRRGRVVTAREICGPVGDELFAPWIARLLSLCAIRVASAGESLQTEVALPEPSLAPDPSLAPAPPGASYARSVDVFSVSASSTFVLTHTPRASFVSIYHNGLFVPPHNYSLDGNLLTIHSGDELTAGDEIAAAYQFQE